LAGLVCFPGRAGIWVGACEALAQDEQQACQPAAAPLLLLNKSSDADADAARDY
jgi:hypothetical protein